MLYNVKLTIYVTYGIQKKAKLWDGNRSLDARVLGGGVFDSIWLHEGVFWGDMSVFDSDYDSSFTNLHMW